MNINGYEEYKSLTLEYFQSVERLCLNVILFMH